MSVTLASNALTTAAAVYDELGIAIPVGGASDKVKRLINAVSARIENHLRRELQRKVFTTGAPELLQGSGGPWLFLGRWPIEDVEQVLVEEQAVEFGRSDEFDAKGMLQSTAGWPRRTGRSTLTGDSHGSRAYGIAAAYTGGYRLPNDAAVVGSIDLPADIEQVCLDEIVMAYRAPRHFITEETTAGGWRRKYADAGQNSRSALMKISQEVLRVYKRKHFGHP